MLSIALAAGNGAHLVAEGGGSGGIRADRDGIGPWETFRLFNRTRPGVEPRHGDSVVLQVFNGRFIAAAAGGTVNAELGWIDRSAEFRIERLAGAGTVRSGDPIALRAADGSFVVAEGNGGGAVNANRPRRGPWETFRITVLGEQLIRLRSRSGRFVSAEGGGGGAVTVNRTGVGLWETFTLVNLSRPGRGIRSADSVALRTWNGTHLRVVRPAAVDGRANRASADARFRVASAREGTIEHGQQITLHSMTNDRFITDRAGVLDASGRTGEDAALFTIEFAERQGIEFDWVPDGAALDGRPFDPPPEPVRSPRDLLTLHFFEELPATTTTSAVLRDAIYGPAPSLASWLTTMSGGAFRPRDAGIFGPFFSPPVARGASTTVGHGVLLTSAERNGVPLASFARDGVIDSARAAILHIKAGGVGGQVHGAGSPVSRSGIRYVGRDAGIGVTTDVDEASRAVLCHEASHLLLDVVDRYGFRRPIRGDLIANRTHVGDWEPFVVERLSGPGALVAGDRVMLRAHNGQHVSVADSPPNLVNVEGPRAGAARFLTIESATSGAITTGSRIAIKTMGGRYVTAELGSDGVLTANRVAMREWETFEILKQGGGGPRISSGDRVCLKGANGLIVSAEVDARDAATSDADRRRGYKWDGHTGGGQGGGFDNADANYSTIMLSLYDRIRFGWVRPRYLTPDNRGSFLIRPFVDSREALILFDPLNPHDWYTVENRQIRENVDEVPSGGLVISWIRDDPGYWQWWLNRSNDPESADIGRRLSPAVISAAASDVAPNMLARPVVFDHQSVTRRNDPGAAFTDGEVVLPLGSGDPSRFRLSFHAGPSGSVAICVR